MSEVPAVSDSIGLRISLKVVSEFNVRLLRSKYRVAVDAIIFLAPISAFDQVLAEDSSVNRLEDSLLLWRTVVSNKLLENVNIVLFLNKCDLLEDKLTAGIKLSSHMTSYGDRPNDYETICRCM